MCICLTVFPDKDKFVLFVSGLKIGGHGTNPLDLQLLVDHVTGHLGEEQVFPCLYADFLTLSFRPIAKVAVDYYYCC